MLAVEDVLAAGEAAPASATATAAAAGDGEAGEAHACHQLVNATTILSSIASCVAEQQNTEQPHGQHKYLQLTPPLTAQAPPPPNLPASDQDLHQQLEKELDASSSTTVASCPCLGLLSVCKSNSQCLSLQ